MKCTLPILLITAIALPCLADTTINYDYDQQHRLVRTDYSASAKVFYSYDAANNLDMEVAITDTKYLKSFLLWFGKTSDALRDFARYVTCWPKPGVRLETDTHG